MIAYDLNDRIISLNLAAQILTGWSEEDAIGEKIHDVFQYNDIKNEHGENQDLKHVEQIVELISHSGEALQVFVSKTPIFADLNPRKLILESP